MQFITEEQIAEFKEAFSFFDKDGDNFVDVGNLPLLVRSLYQNPSQTQLKDWMQEVDPQNNGKIDFPEFLSLMARKYKQPDTQDELMDTMRELKTMAEKSTLVSERQFRVMMISIGDQGERLTEQQMDELYKDLTIDSSGYFRCDDFIRLILKK